MQTIKLFNLGIAFLLELLMLASYAYAGFKLPESMPMKVGLAIALIGIWAMSTALSLIWKQ